MTDIKKLETLTLGPEEYLLIQLPKHVSKSYLNNVRHSVKHIFKEKASRVIVYADDIKFRKVAIPEVNQIAWRNKDETRES